MLIDPTTLVQYAVPYFDIGNYFGQSISSTICLNFRTTIKTIRANRNEFITNWGVFYYCNAWNDNENKFLLYPVVVAVSAVTTFTTPFMVKLAIPFSEYLENITS
jgi:CPA2 family monovalent cation:H+ antiporter-2